MGGVEIVIDRVRAHGNRGDLHQPDRVLGRAVKAGELGERAVGCFFSRVEIAFDGDLGEGRDR